VLARLLLWRTLGLAAAVAGAVILAGLLHDGLGATLRNAGASARGPSERAELARPALVGQGPRPAPDAGARGSKNSARRRSGSTAGRRTRELLPEAALGGGLALAALQLLVGVRWRARRQRRYMRLRVTPYRADRTSVEGLISMFESLHKRLQSRSWRRLLRGQPSLALEAHCRRDQDGVPVAWLAVVCPFGMERMIEASIRGAYPNCVIEHSRQPLTLVEPAVLRLRKHTSFIKRAKLLDRFELAREPPMDRLLTAMAACEEDVFVQLALTPTSALFERYAKHRYKHHEAYLSRERREHVFIRDRSFVEDSELRGGLEVQHRPLFFVDLRVAGASRETCERVSSELRAEGAENRLVVRAATSRHRALARYGRRLARGEGNPWPSPRTAVFASTELAALWHLPSVEYATVPFARGALPVAPAPPAIMRVPDGRGTLRDALGPLCIHPELRRQNTAVPGAVEQGKSSYLAATVAEDLRRKRCAVIVFDPKGDAAEAAVSVVPPQRTCTLLDFAHPTCGFNPLAVDAHADTIADYVVGALKNLFTDSDIRASSDRYLRNAVIAVLAHDPRASLWDAARLLSVGEDGYAYRARVGAHVRTRPEFKEIAEFFTAELSAQLADSRSTTTAKLDAPVNKLARLLNSASIKRVLLNDSLTVDFDRVIAGGEVLVVKGALGAMGAGNTSVLMQLLIGMLDAALARQQDRVPAAERVAVALKVDEAPLVLNRGFAETLALKRSAGLETVACWQADSQWTDREIRDQLDALFAHRVYFATASARDARDASNLMMAAFADVVRPEVGGLSTLGRPDARLHLPKHHAIVSWITPQGRQPPFLAQTIPLHVDPERLVLHAARQAERGARYRADLSQPHWERRPTGPAAREAASRDVREAPQPKSAASQASVASDSPHGIDTPQPPTSIPGIETAPPPTAAESYRELVDLDAAHRMRWARTPATPRVLAPEPLDIEMLALVATMRHVLTSQIHRRFNPARAATTTQRRLKRLSDAGLVERFQFHRRDGGGAPMCYVIAPAGLRLLDDRGRLDTRRPQSDPPSPGDAAAKYPSFPPAQQAVAGDRLLRQARHDVHVTGWVLALEQTLGAGPLRLRGSDEAAISPPLTSNPGGRAAIGPRELRLPGGRTPHGFLRTDTAGSRGEVERFETVRPDASVEIAGVELLVELDDRLPSAGGAAKLERYDHLLAGWALATPRFSRRGAPRPLVVFLCRDRPRARECARRADHVLGACRAYAGEHPHDWEYPGRAAILFAAERDMHEGSLLAYGVHRLPPDVRASAAEYSGEDVGGREPAPEPRELLPRVVR
jgi:Replication-relaxation